MIFAVMSLKSSSALSTLRFDRNASAAVTNDNSSVLMLVGFENKTYSVNSKYTSFGSVTNNSKQVMNLKVTISPEILWNNNKNTWFGIKIGTETAEFRNNNSSPKQVLLSLNPGQTAEAQAALTQSLGTIRASFQFWATDPYGNYSIQLNDTVKSPRRIICN
jgi:hypothetical protein